MASPNPKWLPIAQTWEGERLIVRLSDGPEPQRNRLRTYFGLAAWVGVVLAAVTLPFLGPFLGLAVLFPVLLFGAGALLLPTLESVRTGATDLVLTQDELDVRGSGVGAPKVRIPLRAVRLAEGRLHPFAGLYLRFSNSDLLLPASDHDPRDVQELAEIIQRAADAQREFAREQHQATRAHAEALGGLLDREL